MEDLNSIHEEPQLKEQMEDLNSIHEEPQLKEQMEDLNSIHEEPQLKEQMEDMNSIHEEPQLEEQMEYAKRAGFASRIRNSQRNKETGAIKNQLFTCNRDGSSDIPVAEKTNPMSPAHCPARVFVHIDKKTQCYIISKVVLEHSHPCFADHAEMLPHTENSVCTLVTSLRTTIKQASDRAKLISHLLHLLEVTMG
ncbi:hypothetical protein PIB30_033148 [Stylosanthes scabra]|uniref:FAR1 domain-containing protein n=1 Tax=Stylosanthes scabra TaxID=79078 RepID=A0ABU6XAH8_9FABA|nr:hypothetical protein [Stylosanthes scabra]